jgi:hypothetical protein
MLERRLVQGQPVLHSQHMWVLDREGKYVLVGRVDTSLCDKFPSSSMDFSVLAFSGDNGGKYKPSPHQSFAL